MSAPRYLYDHGMPFAIDLGYNLDDAYERVNIEKKASLIIIDGGVGEGKTTLGVECADYINSKRGLPPISLEKDNHPQLALGGADFTDKLAICHQLNLPAVIYDESGDFNRKGTLSRFNAMLARTFDTYRGFRILVILCLPNFKVLDNALFDNNIPRVLLHCFNRGENTGHFSAYSLYRMLYIRHKMKSLVVQGMAYGFTDPNFRGCFLNLTKERDKALDILSTRGKLDILKQSSMKLAGLISAKDMADKIGRTVIYTKKIIKAMNIKHERKTGITKYYKENLIENIVDYIGEKEKNKRGLN